MPRPPAWLVAPHPRVLVVAVLAQAAVDVPDDLAGRLASLPPPVAPTVTLLSHGAYRNTLAGRGGEHPDHLVFPTTRPNDAVGAPLLHPIHLPTPTHQHLPGDDHDSFHRRDVDVFARLAVHDLRPGLPVGGTRRQPQAGKQRQA